MAYFPNIQFLISIGQKSFLPFSNLSALNTLLQCKPENIAAPLNARPHPLPPSRPPPEQYLRTSGTFFYRTLYRIYTEIDTAVVCIQKQERFTAYRPKVLPPLGSYVTRLFFAINGARRVHEDELVKRLDNEVEVSIETGDK